MYEPQRWPAYPYLCRPWHLRWYQVNLEAEFWLLCAEELRGYMWELWTNMLLFLRMCLCFARGTCKFGKESWLSNWGKADHTYSGISWFGHFETFTTRSTFFASSACRIDKLFFEFGKFCFEDTQMVGGGLVLLGAFHLGFNFCDFLCSRHGKY